MLWRDMLYVRTIQKYSKKRQMHRALDRRRRKSTIDRDFITNERIQEERTNSQSKFKKKQIQKKNKN